MTHTLRRSKSKYARTRRQNKKQRRIRGGGFLDDIVSKFKPSTDAEKCQAARIASQTACSNVEGDIEMMPITSSSDSSSLGEYGASSSTTPVGDGISSSTTPVGDGISSSTIPVGDGISSDASFSEDNDDDTTRLIKPSLNKDFQTIDTQQQSQLAQFGGGKKTKNKKRSQSRRKKLKSRKHKKSLKK